jgi:hypothetical protein
LLLNLKALAWTAGLLWGGACLLVAVANLVAPPYGLAFLNVMAALYPGYHGPTGLGSVAVVALYGALDGAVGGAVFAWVYNRFARRAT